MSKEKIEKMIEALKKCSCVYTECEQECSQCSNEELYDETLKHIARTLYEAGYRKQSEVAREIFMDIDRVVEKYSMGDIEYPAFLNIIAEFKNKYTEG